MWYAHFPRQSRDGVLRYYTPSCYDIYLHVGLVQYYNNNHDNAVYKRPEPGCKKISALRVRLLNQCRLEGALPKSKAQAKETVWKKWRKEIHETKITLHVVHPLRSFIGLIFICKCYCVVVFCNSCVLFGMFTAKKERNFIQIMCNSELTVQNSLRFRYHQSF